MVLVRRPVPGTTAARSGDQGTTRRHHCRPPMHPGPLCKVPVWFCAQSSTRNTLARDQGGVYTSGPRRGLTRSPSPPGSGPSHGPGARPSLATPFFLPEWPTLPGVSTSPRVRKRFTPFFTAHSPCPAPFKVDMPAVVGVVRALGRSTTPTAFPGYHD